MIFTDRLDQILEEMEEISKKKFLLFSSEGESIFGDAQEEFGERISTFAGSSTETQVEDGWIYFRLELHGETEFVLLCSTNGQKDESFVIGNMALCRIRDLFLYMQEPETRLGTLRQILTGEISRDKAGKTCRQLKLDPGRYIIYVIQFKGSTDSLLEETLKNLFCNRSSDFVIEMDDSSMILIKDIEGMEDWNSEQYAKEITDNLQTEALTNVWVGYADPIDTFEQLAEAYQNACTALKIGVVFYAEQRTYYYQKLGIARLIYKLPADLCEMFLHEVLGDSLKIDLDEEMITTVKRFFENNLNISETARQLYIHRNTLVYRLEQIEKKIGLDIRSFGDAMLLSIAMMVRVHLNELSVVK